MASNESARHLLAEAAGEILTEMQQAEQGPVGVSDYARWINTEWADEMYLAYESAKAAIKHLDRAEMYE